MFNFVEGFAVLVSCAGGVSVETRLGTIVQLGGGVLGFNIIPNIIYS